MKVGVLSDTHLREPSDQFIKAVERVFGEVKHILHCGDYVDPSIIEALQARGWEVIGVAGNMDSHSIHRMLPSKRKVTLGGRTIGIIHGWGPPQGLEEKVVQSFDDVDVVVFGHTHRPFWGRVRGVWVLNPGAACGWGSPKGPSAGILDLDDGVEGRIISLEGEKET
jgi:hypothetical protein